jgi:NifU-like protein involved in Fe-S cluster formation
MSTPERLLWYADTVPVALDRPTGLAEKHNVQCGDHCSVAVQIEGDVVRAVSVTVVGCAICRSVAGWLQETAPGNPLSVVLAWSPLHAVTSWGLTLGPLRRKCATLPLETLFDALHAAASADQRHPAS